MNEKETTPKRPPMTRGEWLLMFIPCLVIGLIVIGLMIRKATTVPAIETDNNIFRASVSADGKHLLLRSSSKNGIASTSRWNLATREKEWERSGPRTGVWGTPSPSGTKYLNERTGAVEVSEASSGVVVGSWPQIKKSYYAWLDDEKWVLRIGEDAALVNSSNGQVIRELPHRRWFRDSAGVHLIKISPNGKMAAVREYRRGISQNAKSPSQNVQPGGRLAIVSWPAGVKLAEAPGDMYEDFTWTADSRSVYAITGPVSGNSLLLQASLAQLDAASGKTFWIHLPMTAPNGEKLIATYAALSPGGRFVAVPYVANGVVVYDAKDGTVKLDIAPMKQANPRTNPPLFAPSNKFLIRVGESKVEIHSLPQY